MSTEPASSPASSQPGVVSTNPADNTAMHPDVNANPGFWQLLILGFQHVLACYAGAVAVPLFVGSALVQAGKWIPATSRTSLLRTSSSPASPPSCNPSASGASVSASLSFKAAPFRRHPHGHHRQPIRSGRHLRCRRLLGTLIILFAPLFSRLLRFFPPLVTGTVLLIIGLTLMPVAADWVGGSSAAKANGSFGSGLNIGIAMGVLLLILIIERFGPGWLARISVLVGMIAGFLVCIPLGMVNFDGIEKANWVGVTRPLAFGLQFQPAAIIAMCIVSLVTMVEATGDVLAIGEATQTPITKRRIADALRADGFATMLGGFMNTFQYTAFAQNIGVLSITGVKSRYVTASAGGILIVLGLLPKAAEVIAAIPAPVLGGAGIALFGTVAASGVRTLSKVTFTNTNIWVVAVPTALALLPAVSPTLFSTMPAALQTFLSSGICIGAVAAIILNLLFNTGHNAPTEQAGKPAAHDAPRGGEFGVEDANDDGKGDDPHQLHEDMSSDA
ncbi:MAG: nucleobase:cation symporter-2 family protein [Lawsonella clevelandensis]